MRGSSALDAARADEEAISRLSLERLQAVTDAAVADDALGYFGVAMEAVLAALRGLLRTSGTGVLALFREWDADASGKINASEMSDALESLGYVAPVVVISRLFGQIDADGSRSVSFDEFQQWLVDS